MSGLRRYWATIIIVCFIFLPAVFQKLSLHQFLNGFLPASATAVAQIARYENGIKVYDSKLKSSSSDLGDAKRESFIFATKNNEVLHWRIDGGTAVAMSAKGTEGKISVVSPAGISEVKGEGESTASGIKVAGESYEVQYDPNEDQPAIDESKVEDNPLAELWRSKFMPRKAGLFYLITILMFLFGIIAVILHKKIKLERMFHQLHVYICAVGVWYFAVHLIDPITTDLGLVGGVFFSGVQFSQFFGE